MYMLCIMESFKWTVICIAIVNCNVGAETPLNESLDIDRVVNNLNETTFQIVPRNRHRREHGLVTNLVQLNPIAFTKGSLQPNLKHNLRSNPPPVVLPMKKKNDSAKSFENSRLMLEKQKLQATIDPIRKHPTVILPTENKNGNILIIPKVSKRNPQIKTVEEPREVPARNKKVDSFTEPTNVTITALIPEELIHGKEEFHDIHKPENEKDIQTKKVTDEKLTINLPIVGNNKKASNPKNYTEIEHIEQNSNKELILTEAASNIAAINKESFTVNNTDKNITHVTGLGFLEKLLNSNKPQTPEVQLKEIATNDTVNHITIQNRNYEEIVERCKNGDPLSSQSSYQEQYPKSTVYPIQEWSYGNQYSAVERIDPNQADYEYFQPQHNAMTTIYNDGNSCVDDSKGLWNYYPSNNKYVIWRSWKNSDITINSNNKPLRINMMSSKDWKMLEC